MTRWKAAAIHFSLSVLLCASLAALVLWLWYPPAMLRMSGIDQLIGIIVAVDVVAGPLLTLAVYKHGKPGLRFDLTVIVVVQLLLLSYGLHTLFAIRPVFLVGAVDRINLVTANEVEAADLALARPPYDQLSWTGPLLVGAPMPSDLADRNKLVDDTMLGKDIQVQPKYFAPFEQVSAELLKRAKPVVQLLDKSAPEDAARLHAAIGDQPADAMRYLPLAGTRGNAVMLIDAATGSPIKPVAAEPWP